MAWAAFAQTFVTLLVIMDPVGTAPIFMALTAGRTNRSRRLLAIQAAAAAGLIIAGFALFGRLVLTYLGVTVQALSIAGGLLLLLVALQMFRGESMEPRNTRNVALVPLASPLLAGPGAIAAVMVLAGRHDTLVGRLAIIGAVLAVVVVVALGLLLAERIGRLVRPAAIGLITNVLALLLSAIAVQLILSAVQSLRA
ncbi:MAG: MarC family protein [Candidatus Dormibacteraeota bacterium]|nr:MarC family protein [Candidatus Dormibacteraeota bacterium]